MGKNDAWTALAAAVLRDVEPWLRERLAELGDDAPAHLVVLQHAVVELVNSAPRGGDGETDGTDGTDGTYDGGVSCL